MLCNIELVKVLNQAKELPPMSLFVSKDTRVCYAITGSSPLMVGVMLHSLFTVSCPN